MGKDSFDDEIKKKLDGFVELYDGSTWDRLSSFLDDMPNNIPDSEATISEEEIESIVKEKLENHQESVQEKHWQQLKSELDELDARKERLWTIKLIEATILLLLIYTYWNFASYPHDLLDGYQEEINVEIDQNIFASETSSSSNSADLASKTSKELGNNFSIKNDRFSQINAASINNHRLSGILSLHSEEQFQSFIQVESEHAIIGLDKLDRNRVTPADATQLITATDEFISANTFTPVVASLAINPLMVSKIETKMMTEPLAEIVATNIHKGLWITVGFSKDVNLINSSVNVKSLQTHVNSGLYGTSLSLLASYQMKSLEFETGARFSQKNYFPGLITSFTKASSNTYLETQLDQIAFNQLQIPIVAKIHALNETTDNLYALGGIAVNMIMDYDYSVQKKVQASSRVASLVSNNTNDLSSLPNGLAEGGEFSDNTYLTAIVGFGYQAQLKKYASFYLQPQYQFTITDGANDYIRKVHTFNIEAGLKFNF